MKSSLAQIRFVAFDFDGVFTDNSVWVSQTGEEMVRCSRSDGQGLARLKKIGVECAIFSTETNPVVRKRAEKLGLECHSGLEDKVSHLRAVLADKRIELSEVAFVGNDINDIPCLKVVGLPVVVADAYAEAKACARWVLQVRGGEGAVREFCDLLYFSRETALEVPIES